MLERNILTTANGFADSIITESSAPVAAVREIHIDHMDSSKGSTIELEDTLLLSYIKKGDEIFDCVVTTSKILVYRDTKLVCSTELKNLSAKSRVKCHVYSAFNLIVTVHSDRLKLWKLDNSELVNVHDYFDINDFGFYDFRFQHVSEDESLPKRALIVAFNPSCIVKVYQLAVSSIEPMVIFQQNMLLGGDIINLEIFPASEKNESISYFIAETEGCCQLFTVDTTYIKHVSEYLADVSIIKHVESLEINAREVVLSKPTTYKILNKNRSTQRNFIISEFEIKMGSYYYNLLNLFNGYLPKLVASDFKVPFDKISNMQQLDTATQLFFKSKLNLTNKYTNFCLVHHSHCRVAVMCYNIFSLTETEPKFFNLTGIKDLENFVMYSDSKRNIFNVLINTSCKIRHGIISSKNQKKLLLTEYDFNSQEKQSNLKSYFNIENPSLIYSFLSMNIDRFFLMNGHLALLDEKVVFKRHKVVSSSKKNYNYLTYQLNTTSDSNTFVISNLSKGGSTKDSIYYQFSDAFNGLLFIEYNKKHGHFLSIKKLFVNKYNNLQTTNIVKVKHRFGNNKDSFNIKFFKDLTYSTYISGVISYTNDKGKIILEFFNLHKERFIQECLVEIDYDIAANVSRYIYKKAVDARSGVEQIEIYADKTETTDLLKSHWILRSFVPTSFNSSFKLVWLVANNNVNLTVRFVENKHILFSHSYKPSEVQPYKWQNTKRWSISTCGKQLIYTDDAISYHYSFNKAYLLPNNAASFKIDVQKCFLFPDTAKVTRNVFFTKNIALVFNQITTLIVSAKESLTPLEISFLTYDTFNGTFSRSNPINVDISVADPATFSVLDIVLLNPTEIKSQALQLVPIKLLITYEQRRGLDKSVTEIAVLYKSEDTTPAESISE